MINESSPFLTQEILINVIEKIVAERRVNYLDAMLLFCEENEIEPEDLVELITDNLREKIRFSAIEEGLMKPEPTLPI